MIIVQAISSIITSAIASSAMISIKKIARHQQMQLKRWNLESRAVIHSSMDGDVIGGRMDIAASMDG